MIDFEGKKYKPIITGTDEWDDCHMCGRHVRCGKCGNNCCNGGTGTLQDDTECGCETAYIIQDKGE